MDIIKEVTGIFAQKNLPLIAVGIGIGVVGMILVQNFIPTASYVGLSPEKNTAQW